MTPKEKAMEIIKTCDSINVGLDNKIIKLSETMACFSDVSKAIDIALKEQAEEIFSRIDNINVQGKELPATYMYGKIKKIKKKLNL